MASGGREEDEDYDLRNYIDCISRLSIHDDPERPESVLSFRPASVSSLGAGVSVTHRVPTLDISSGAESDSEDEQPDSGLGPSGGDEVTGSALSSPPPPPDPALDGELKADSDLLCTSSISLPIVPTLDVKVKKGKKKKSKGAHSGLIDVLPPVKLYKEPEPSLLLNKTPEVDPFIKKSNFDLDASSLLTARTAANKILDPLILQKKVDKCFDFANEECVSDWLMRANKNAIALRNWCAVPSQFVEFTQFWLVSFIESQRVELFAMEHEILLEELTVGFSQGLDTAAIKKDDLYAVLCVAFSEYPDKFFGPHGNKFFVDTLVLLLTGKSYSYKKLLSSIRYSSADKAKLHIVLSIRAFAIFNYFNAILEFFQSYRSLEKTDIMNEKRLTVPVLSNYITETIEVCLAKDALATLSYFVKVHKVNPNARDEQERSLLFRAVVAQAINCVSWLVKNVTSQTLNMPSESGNTCLHAAISLGNIAVARVLLQTSGIKVDASNIESGDMTPLGLAVFQGNQSACRLLLQYGADAKAMAPNLLGTDEPLPLAQFALDLGHPQIALMLDNHE